MKKEAAVKIADKVIQNTKFNRRVELAIIESGVEDSKPAWIVPYQTKDYPVNYLIGIGPFVIDKETGKIYETSSGDYLCTENIGVDFTKFKEGKLSEIDWEDRLLSGI